MTDTTAPDAGLGASSTADEVLAGVDLSGRRALVTGGASGIGLETTRALAAAGAELVVAARDPDVAARSIAALGVLPRTVRVEPLDLADRASVRAFVQRWHGPLHILVANAGVALTPLSRTVEGWELQLATNHIGHAALAIGLRPRLAPGARVVVLSSGAHLRWPVDFDDLHFERRPYDRWAAYGQSKSANVLFAVGAASRWTDDGIAVNAVMPGVIETNLQRHFAVDELAALRADATLTFKSPAQGAATSVFAAASPAADGITGRYLEDCAVAGIRQRGQRVGVAEHAMDPERAGRLWSVTEQLLSE